ncbi:histone-lysine N-methyltransferase, H3 lysine-79 specific-like, partial [Diaphorina citri]|uniref:Histone-lysine N-methyltransferase, H3 lysine-79 specific-like n=1 Tax=Diaphorina citri TaxID=121845 RepID=A0A3Q0IN18_DIACI
EKELQDRLEKERKQREAEEQKEIERKRREKELEEQIERERNALKQKALEEERKHQEELERIKKEQELLEQERKRNEEMIQKEKEELRKQKEQELRKQIEELKEIGREKERQRLRDLEVIAQLEEERKCQKLKEEQGRALEEVRRQSQSPKSPTRTHTEHTTFVSKIPQPTSPSKKSPSPVQTSSGIPEDKLNQHSITEVNTGRLYTTKPLKRFLECYQHVLSWLTTDVEAFVNGHQDMGSGLALARQFYDLHVQYLQDLEERKEDISSIIQHIPSNIKPDARADMDRKLSNLNDKYSRLYSTIHTRLKLSKHYVSIHELSVNLSIEYDLLDLLLGKRQQQDQLIDDKLEKLNQMRSLFRNVCTRFFKLVEKIGDSDTYLDIERTRTCIDTLLDHFDNRNLNIDSKYHSYQIQISKLQDTKIRLMQNMADSNKIGDSDTYLDIERTRTCIDTLLDHFDNRNLNIDSKYHSYQIQISKLQDTKIRLMQNMADSNKACFAKTF